MPPSWKDSLSQLLTRSRNDDRIRLTRTCLVGIGSDLRGDDSAGLAVARALLDDERLRNAPDLLVLEGGLAPENQTGKIRAFRPELVLFVDAAQMDEPPGAIQFIPLETLDGMSASSHSLPLSMLASYIISDLGCQVEVLGIQPAKNEIDMVLNFPVRAAVNEVICLVSDLFASKS
ncbi:MAG: hydrogenase 3 maturation endopeptidase HyCI [Chloroflexota bacterium]